MSQFDTYLMFRYDTSEQKVTEKIFMGVNIAQKTVKKERLFNAEKAAKFSVFSIQEKISVCNICIYSVLSTDRRVTPKSWHAFCNIVSVRRARTN